MGSKTSQPADAEQMLARQNKLLESIRVMQMEFLNKGISYGWCDATLKNLLALSDSQFGFICELLHKDDGTPFIKSHTISNISWSKETNDFYERHKEEGLEFFNFNSLWGSAIATGEPVIANDPDNDPRRGGYPKEDGHPTLTAFLGLPIKDSKGMVNGVIGVANCPDGYGPEQVEFLEIFVSTYGNLIEKARIEAEVKKKYDEIERMGRLMIGRELKMEEMRREIKRLKERGE